MCRFLTFIFLVVFTHLFATSLNLEMVGKHVVLMNGKTGQIIFEKDGYVPTENASTTKIATALYTYHLLGDEIYTKCVTARREALASISTSAKRQSKFRCPPWWIETGSDHVGIKPGETMRVYDLLYAAMLASANDASNVLAQELGGTIPSFMEGMNAYLKSIGCRGTHFKNPSGLSHPEHLTTAYDLALMGKHFLEIPVLREMGGTLRYTCPETNLEYKRYFVSKNKLLQNGAYFYPYAIGIKTGTTEASGKNLVAAAEHEGRLLVGAFLNYPYFERDSLYNDVRKAFDAAFNEPVLKRTILEAGETPLKKKLVGGNRLLLGYLDAPLCYTFYPSEETDIKLQVMWEPPPFPIKTGERVGEVRLLHPSGTVLQNLPLYAARSVYPSFFHALYLTLTHPFFIKGGLLFAAVIILSNVFRRLWGGKKRYNRGS